MQNENIKKKIYNSHKKWGHNCLMDGSKKKSYLFSHTVIKHIIINIINILYYDLSYILYINKHT